MKKLLGILTVLLLVGMAGQAQALTGQAWTEEIGFTQARFHINPAAPDSGTVPKKVVLFYGTTLANMIRKDSLTTVTDPDSIAKAVGTFQNGTTYYWYMSVQDSGSTIYVPFDYATAAYSFTTTDYLQDVDVLSTGYSTASIEHDTLNNYVGTLDSIILDYGIVSGTYTVAETLTTVTRPDTIALTGLMEGETYYGRFKAWQPDSLGTIVDTSAEFSFSTTDLQYEVTVISSGGGSLALEVDTVNAVLPIDSLILQWGAGLGGIARVADTITSVTEPDTFTITGLVEGGTYYYRVKAFLPDSSAIETTSVGTYTRPHNDFTTKYIDGHFAYPSATLSFMWDFTLPSQNFSTGPIPIEAPWYRFHVRLDGEDDVSLGDSIQVFLWSWSAFGDSTIMDTLQAMDADIATITPLKFRTYPGEITDSSMTYYPQQDWGTHFSVSAAYTDTTVAELLVHGVRSVHVLVEKIDY